VTEPLTRAEIEALAEAYAEPSAAAAALERAGLARLYQPWSAGNALAFWQEVSTELGSGRLVDGRLGILRVAAEEFPANPVFGDGSNGDEVPAATAGNARRGRPAGARARTDEHPPGDQRQPAMVINAAGGNVIFGGYQRTVIGTGGTSPAPAADPDI
jgi:hypothetical protein